MLSWQPNDLGGTGLVTWPDGHSNTATCAEFIDFALTFRDLRAMPYPLEPKDAVVEAIKGELSKSLIDITYCGSESQESFAAVIAKNVRPLIRAEVLAGLTVDTLVEELVKRGAHLVPKTGPTSIPYIVLHTDGAK